MVQALYHQSGSCEDLLAVLVKNNFFSIIILCNNNILLEDWPLIIQLEHENCLEMIFYSNSQIESNSTIFQFVCLSVWPFVCLSACLPVCLSICLSVSALVCILLHLLIDPLLVNSWVFFNLDLSSAGNFAQQFLQTGLKSNSQNFDFFVR